MYVYSYIGRYIRNYVLCKSTIKQNNDHSYWVKIFPILEHLCIPFASRFTYVQILNECTYMYKYI